MLCAEGVLKTKKTQVKRRKCVNAPNCKPKQNAWEKGWNTSCTSGELNPSFLLGAAPITPALWKRVFLLCY